jgi:A/G-specific adenine glycosylase
VRSTSTPRRPAHALAFTRRLLAWFRREGRQLPWRATRDPYGILVSEFMLQQTQVARVVAYWARFVDRYPTVHDLAQAPAAQVREAWEGLGYYRRADNLHRLAGIVVRDHSGTVPGDPKTLVTFPGVGRYTAGAVASFAYEHRTPAVDTNVARVLRRAFTPRAGRNTAAERRLWDLARRLLPTRRRTAWEFNQALMDLGARICTARAPRCPVCPVRPACTTGRRISSKTRRQPTTAKLSRTPRQRAQSPQESPPRSNPRRPAS